MIILTLLTIISANTCWEPCGECDAGTYVCSEERNRCVYPGEGAGTGLPVADTGTRPRFYPEDYTGVTAPHVRISAASGAAAAVGGVVVLSEVYEITDSVYIHPGVTYTGGGIRRACIPAPALDTALLPTDTCVKVDDVTGAATGYYLLTTGPSYFDLIGTVGITSVNAGTNELCANSAIGLTAGTNARMVRVFNMLTMPSGNEDGIVFDSVLFDGNSECNNYTHDWRFNNTVALRGRNTVQNSVFINTPSENLTVCGSIIRNNIGVNMYGSLIHKSCTPATDAPIDLVVGNYVERANLATDAISEHTEGVITLSSNAGNIYSSDNVFRHGSEGAFGYVSNDDRDIISYNDCYAHLKRGIYMYSDADSATFQFIETEYIDTIACEGSACP